MTETTTDKARPTYPPEQPWPTSHFKLRIDGLETDCAAVKKVGPLALKIGIKKRYSGRGGFPTIEPTTVDESNLTLSLPERNAAGFLSWFEASAKRGSRIDGAKTGKLEYLADDSKTVLGVEFMSLAIVSATKVAGNVDVELYCEEKGFRFY